MRAFKLLMLAFGIFLASHTSQAASNYNVALGKPTTQSSTQVIIFNGVPIYGRAGYAVDGNTDGNWANGSVQGTSANTNSWWQVDLAEVKFIRTINLWNRTDCCSVKATNFYVFLSSTPFVTNTLANALSQPGVTIHYFPGQMGSPTALVVNKSARYVRVQLAGTNNLSMAEVEVVGDDPGPGISVVKSSSPSVEVAAGQIVTYTYQITNTGNVTLSNVTASDVHNGYGTPPVPKNEALTDNAPVGDSTDATANNGVWSTLGPGDKVTMTGTYTVVQQDIDLRQ